MGWGVHSGKASSGRTERNSSGFAAPYVLFRFRKTDYPYGTRGRRERRRSFRKEKTPRHSLPRARTPRTREPAAGLGAARVVGARAALAPTPQRACFVHSEPAAGAEGERTVGGARGGKSRAARWPRKARRLPTPRGRTTSPTPSRRRRQEACAGKCARGGGVCQLLFVMDSLPANTKHHRKSPSPQVRNSQLAELNLLWSISVLCSCSSQLYCRPTDHGRPRSPFPKKRDRKKDLRRMRRAPFPHSETRVDTPLSFEEAS